MRYESIEINDKKEEKKKTNCLRVIGCFILYVYYLRFIFIGFGLSFLIVSIYYIITLKFKIFYLLNIISAIIPITFIIMLCFGGSDRSFAIRILILIFGKYIYDGVCYFFYFYENIITFAPLILLIISDVLLSPAIYIASNDLDCCCKENCWFKL